MQPCMHTWLAEDAWHAGPRLYMYVQGGNLACLNVPELRDAHANVKLYCVGVGSLQWGANY